MSWRIQSHGEKWHSLGVGLVLGERRRLSAAVVALERVAHRRQARVRVRLGVDRSDVPVVRVHSGQQLAVAGDHVADLHLALDLGAAVSARPVQLAKVLDAVRVDLDKTWTRLMRKLQALSWDYNSPPPLC